MSDPKKDISPSTVLDTILADDGPMPAARLGIRTLAFVLDFILCSAVATILIWKVFLPMSHPGSFLELNEWIDQLLQWLQNSESTRETMPKPGNDLLAALRYASEVQLLTFWAYFGIGEIFLGGSLGKRACRLRTISTLTLAPLNVFAALLRAGIKTAALFFLSPLLLIATLAALFFNPRRQTGHDLLARTAVIDEKHLKSGPPLQN
ncbi:MAG: hypothetical protein GWO81_07605 [Verrucomicrobia bacterium]|nr:hypothetical protein [Verrucomicrobiota bacterium]